MASKNSKLVWYSPKWATHPKQWWVLRKHLLSTGPLLRMSAATLIAVSAIIGYLKFAFPGIVLPNLWSVVFLLPAVIGFTVLQMGILSLFRYRVLVTPKKIVISHGQSATIIKPESLNYVTLTVHDFGKNRIRFNYGLKSKNRLVTVGLSDDCDLFKFGRTTANRNGNKRCTTQPQAITK